MNQYLFHQDTFQRQYNCSFYSVDDVPLEDRQHPKLGLGLIVLSLTLELLYIPGMVIINRHLQHSCYKFMCFICVLNMLILPICGVVTGWFALEGTVYCSRPKLMLHIGMIASGECL